MNRFRTAQSQTNRGKFRWCTQRMMNKTEQKTDGGKRNISAVIFIVWLFGIIKIKGENPYRSVVRELPDLTISENKTYNFYRFESNEVRIFIQWFQRLSHVCFASWNTISDFIHLRDVFTKKVYTVLTAHFAIAITITIANWHRKDLKTHTMYERDCRRHQMRCRIVRHGELHFRSIFRAAGCFLRFSLSNWLSQSKVATYERLYSLSRCVKANHPSKQNTNWGYQPTCCRIDNKSSDERKKKWQLENRNHHHVWEQCEI